MTNSMNDDLISRQAAIAVADSSDYVGLSVDDVKKVTDEVIKGLRQLPSAQPERKTGRWIKMSDADGKYYACSECGEDLPRHINRTHYCPNCGADMRNAGEIAKNIVHEAIDHSVWSDTVNVEEMHKVVDDKYADIRGEQDE